MILRTYFWPDRPYISRRLTLESKLGRGILANMNHLITFIEYMAIGTFVGGVLIWIYHAIILGNKIVEWDLAFVFGIIFGLMFAYRQRNDNHPDRPL